MTIPYIKWYFVASSGDLWGHGVGVVCPNLKGTRMIRYQKFNDKLFWCLFPPKSSPFFKLAQVLEQTSIFVFAISGILLYLIGLLTYMQWTRNDALSANPVLSGIRGIADEISQAHVLYMEFAASTNSGELKDAASHLQRAIDIAKGLPPGKNEFYRLAHDPESSVKLDEHLENIGNIAYSLRENLDLTSKGKYTVKFDGDQLFDQLHREAINNAQGSTEMVRQMVQRHLWDQQKTFLLLISLGIAGLFFTGISIYYYDKKNKSINKALLESEEKFRKLSELAFEGIALIQNMKISVANHAFAKIFGYEVDEIIGKEMGDFIAEENISSFSNKISTSFYKSFEVTGRRKDGNLLFIDLRTGLTHYSGMEAQVLAIRDITEQIRIRERLEKARHQAEECTKLKDKFVSMVAHDIRTPFSTIMGFLQLMQDDSSHPLCAKHKANVARCLNVGEGLIRLTENLLSMNRLNNGKIVLQARFIDASFVANHVIHLLEPLAIKKKIRLASAIPKFTRIFADMDLYHQVIENLVSNAIKFSREGDAITLFIPQKNPVGIAVKDTGVGIPRERHALLFEVAQNRSTLGTNRERGTGLGLPYCRDIMLAHGGTLEFESKNEEGSVFYTRLPARRPLVMVVDDDDLIRSGIRGCLELLDAEVIDASNGMDAIKKIENSIPNLIISDVYMPGTDGIDFASRIKEMDPYREIPFIFVTAYPDVKAEIKKRIAYFQDNDFLVKPFGKDDLIGKAIKHVGRPFQDENAEPQ